MAAGTGPAVRESQPGPAVRVSQPGPVARESQWTRWAPIGGIAFIVLFVIGMALYSTPDVDNAPGQISSFYDDKGNRTEIIISGYLLVLSGVFFLWFLGSLRARLLEAEGGPGRLTSIMFASGVVFTAMLMAAAACFMFVAGEITFADAPVDPEIARVLPDIGYSFLLIAGGFAAIAMIDAASILVIRTGVLPSWIGWLGFVAAVVLLVAALVYPFAALLVWVGVVSLALLQLNGVNLPLIGPLVSRRD
jgi:hypothetical protein